MYYIYRKRITRIEVPLTGNENLDEILPLVDKNQVFNEKLISDSFFVEDRDDGKGMILAKEKIVYKDTIPITLDKMIGKTFT